MVAAARAELLAGASADLASLGVAGSGAPFTAAGSTSSAAAPVTVLAPAPHSGPAGAGAPSSAAPPSSVHSQDAAAAAPAPTTSSTSSTGTGAGGSPSPVQAALSLVTTKLVNLGTGPSDTATTVFRLFGALEETPTPATLFELIRVLTAASLLTADVASALYKVQMPSPGSSPAVAAAVPSLAVAAAVSPAAATPSASVPLGSGNAGAVDYTQLPPPARSVVSAAIELEDDDDEPREDRAHTGSAAAFVPAEPTRSGEAARPRTVSSVARLLHEAGVEVDSDPQGKTLAREALASSRHLGQPHKYIEERALVFDISPTALPLSAFRSEFFGQPRHGPGGAGSKGAHPGVQTHLKDGELQAAASNFAQFFVTAYGTSAARSADLQLYCNALTAAVRRGNTAVAIATDIVVRSEYVAQVAHAVQRRKRLPTFQSILKDKSLSAAIAQEAALITEPPRPSDTPFKRPRAGDGNDGKHGRRRQSAWRENAKGECFAYMLGKGACGASKDSTCPNNYKHTPSLYRQRAPKAASQEK